MAAVQIARRAGAEVFATAGSVWKRELLRSLGVTHVFDSRSAKFVDEIGAMTEGRGVDVVLNSLSGPLIESSFHVVARHGRFIEIGKRDIKDPAWVAALDRGISYHIVDWGETAAKEPELIGGMFRRLLESLRRGELSSLPRHVFSLDEAADAFRFMAQASHVGKIVVRHHEDEKGSSLVRRDGTYLVTGGLSGLGLAAGRWLVERGAGRVVLVGRRAVTEESRVVLQAMGSGSTAVVLESLDVTHESELVECLARLRGSGPPLRGIIHGAGTLDDAGLLQQDAERFARVFAPKVLGAELLDRHTRGDPLDWFVMFSSVAAILGSPGQANHSAANACLDLMARRRQSRGLHGLSINWGAWAEVGAAADRGISDQLAAQGLGALTTEQGLRAFERLLKERKPQVAVLPIDWRRFIEHSTGGVTPSFLTEVVASEKSSVAKVEHQAVQRGGPVNLREQLAGLPQSRVQPTVAAFVRERALRALGLDPTREVEPTTPLAELGLDSLLAVELRNALAKALGQSMPATLLFDYPTLETLTQYILSDVLCIPRQPESKVASLPRDSRNLVDSIEDLSDDEVERQLAALSAKK
jgi:NADPH:quinone reductase-like Zn-dependent oxidoreductase/acyl carrier protein